MTPLLALAVAILVSLVLSTIIVRILAQPLHVMLQKLCPTMEAGRFWVAFTAVMLYVPRTLRSTLAAALFGSFAALLVVGYEIASARPAAGVR
jgi:hypothetical protein